MNPYINEVIDVLNLQADISTCLLEISKHLKVAVEKSNITKIDNLVKTQSALMMKFSGAEKKRNKYLNSFKKDMEYVGDDLTITKIKQYVNRNQADKLDEVNVKLKSTLDKLQNCNKVNMALIKRKMEWVDYSLAFLQGNDIDIYNNDGKQTNNNMFVNDLV